tara:strand:+ start:49 stop:609 length:561 start_codon:yes stop_codon:yes gene_type:complete
MGRMKDKMMEEDESNDRYDEHLVDEAYAMHRPMIPHWEDRIRRIWESILKLGITPNFGNPDTYVENTFLSEIWHMSTQAFDIPREIQVVVDSNDRLHISVGTPGFVEFKIDPIGMKLPIKCWIHTHPMGKAYFSGTDWRTLKTWKPMMETAIVLGDNEYWAYTLESEIVKTVRFATLTPPKVGEEE